MEAAAGVMEGGGALTSIMLRMSKAFSFVGAGVVVAGAGGLEGAEGGGLEECGGSSLYPLDLRISLILSWLTPM